MLRHAGYFPIHSFPLLSFARVGFFFDYYWPLICDYMK